MSKLALREAIIATVGRHKASWRDKTGFTDCDYISDYVSSNNVGPFEQPKKVKKGDGALYMLTVTGGEAGGNCYGGEPTWFYEPDAEKRTFEVLGEFIQEHLPGLKYSQFLELQKLVAIDYFSVNELYGNRTDYKIHFLSVRHLDEFMSMYGLTMKSESESSLQREVSISVDPEILSNLLSEIADEYQVDHWEHKVCMTRNANLGDYLSGYYLYSPIQRAQNEAMIKNGFGGLIMESKTQDRNTHQLAAREQRSEPYDEMRFPSFDIFLTRHLPDLLYKDYRSLQGLIEREEYSVHGYYGDSTTWSVRFISVDELAQRINDLGLTLMNSPVAADELSM